MNPSRVGPYEILEQLGSGGMGSVFLGRHEHTGELAAVKVLPASLAREEGFVERFNREVESLQRLTNPHIVRLYSSGMDDETYYYSMEYVDGETALALIRREKRVPWRQAVAIAVQVCLALKAAHDAGIIHRDLKPSNLLIAKDGTVKLSDFGVAQVFAEGRLTMTGGIIGTAEFMSPEQAQGKRATKHSDLYSLGAVLYALITGRPPFSGGAAVDVIQKHKFGLFDKPRHYVPDLPRAVEEVICQLLEKDPAKRFPDAFVLQRRLEQLLTQNEGYELQSVPDDAQTGVILAEGATADPDTPTVASSDRPATRRVRLGPGPATFMKEAVRSELERVDKPHGIIALLDNTVVQITLLVVLIGGSVWLFQSRRTAPNPEEIDTADTPERESEAKHFLRIARHLKQTGETGQAIAKLRALKILLASDPNQKALFDQTSQFLQTLEASQPSRTEQYKLLQDSITRATQLDGEGRPEAAAAIWSAIVELYGHDPAAAEFVEQAKKALER